MRHYALRDFLRAAPNELLAEYFGRTGLLSEVDFSHLTPRKIEPVFDAIQEIPDEQRANVDTDFQDIFALSFAGGMKLLLEEAEHNGLDFLPCFEPLKGHYARAFWAFLNHKPVFEKALHFACRDNLTGHWRVRRGLPVLTLPDFTNRNAEFTQSIAALFKNEGRGKACTIDYDNRGRFHYFFAYPEDYSQSHLHYVNGVLKRGSHSPAFEVIFIYDSVQGALDIYHEGSKDVVESLQEIFAKALLGLEQLMPSKKTGYELDVLKHGDFRFAVRPEWGIESVNIIEIGLSRWLGNENRHTILKCGKSASPAIYEELDLFFPFQANNGRPSRASVLPFRAMIRAEFKPEPGKRKTTQRTFNVTLSGCNLKYEGRDLVLRQMLADSGLEGSNDTAKQNAESVFEPA